MLNDVIKFKVHIQRSLENYEEFVAMEVERECEEQDAAENGQSAAVEQQLHDDEEMEAD